MSEPERVWFNRIEKLRVRHCEAQSADLSAEALRAKAEAIQISTAETFLDCFAEPVIWPRFARTGWLAMTGVMQLAV